MKSLPMLYYKGYRTKPQYDSDDKLFHGKILGIRDVVHYQSDTAQDAEKEFRASVDEYLAFCAEIGKVPQKEYRGSFHVHIPSDLHMKVDTLAQAQGITLSKAVEQALLAYVQS